MANYSRRNATAAELAAVRADKMDSAADAMLFMKTFNDYRGVAARLWLLPTSPLEIDTIGRVARDAGPVQEAAMIEALASLRAEGVRL